MKGLKTCPKCGAETGCRANVCPNAKCLFDFKTIRVKKAVAKKDSGYVRTDDSFDWRSLKRGDRFKVVAGSGPTWAFADGRKEPIGYSGFFQVQFVDKQGIHCSSPDEGGHCYVYMGPTRKSISGGILRKHKISKVKKCL